MVSIGRDLPLSIMEASVKELDEGIREYARKSGLSSKELATILANKTAVELYMTFHKNEARSEALWNDAYVFGLYSNTYKFNEAKKNSDYEDAIEFLIMFGIMR